MKINITGTLSRLFSPELLKDIRFWIFFFFLIRLTGITNPPLEAAHNWRQSLTCMIAQNFYEGDNNIMYPVINMAGNKSGIIGSEFPLFNYLIYLLSLLSGYTHWYGRLINLVVSSIGIYYFYLLTVRLINKNTAFNASIVLLSSVWFAYSRKIMPDTFSIALVIAGLYYGYEFMHKGNVFRLLGFFILVTAGGLSKIPALSIVSVCGLLLFIKQIPAYRKQIFAATTTLSIFVVLLWYFYWVPYLIEHYQYRLYFPKSITEGIREIALYIPELLEKFYFGSLASYIGFAAFIAGLYYIAKSDLKFLKLTLGLISIVFAFFIVKTGAVFPTHSYYIIPFTPVMALAAGYGIHRLTQRYRYAGFLLVLIAFEGIANQQHDFFIKDNMLYKTGLVNIVDNHIERGQLIIINGGSSPQDIYFSGRKGWTVKNELLNNKSIDSLKNEGASYLITDKHKLSQFFTNYSLIYKDSDYSIYDLKK